METEKQLKRKYHNKDLNIAYNDGYEEGRQEARKELIKEFENTIRNFPFKNYTDFEIGEEIKPDLIKELQKLKEKKQ